MKNIFKKISAVAAAAVLSAGCAVSAFAAGTTYNDVIAAAGANGVPSNNIAQLKNYLMVNQDAFNSADYDYMISQIQSAGGILRSQLGVSDLSSLSEDELKAKVKALDPGVIEQIKDMAVSTAATFGVSVGFDATNPTTVVVTAVAPKNHADGSKTTVPSDDGTGKPNENPQIQTGGDTKAANTGDNAFGTVEAVCAAAIALAAMGFTVIYRINRKLEEE